MYTIYGLIVALASSFFNLSVTTSFGQSPSGMPEQGPGMEQSLKLNADLVLVDVLAVQKKTGRIIGDLKQDDFTVLEDGVKQTISYFREKLPARSSC